MNEIKPTGIFALFLFVLVSQVLNPQWAAGEVFEYRYAAGARYRILSVVDEAVFVNRVLSHRVEILNRISIEVTGVADGKGQHRAVFQTSERFLYSAELGTQDVPAGFLWSREYESEFVRDRLGYLTIDQRYFMPVVRNVPAFPGRDLQILERWSAEGYEIHDLRDSFGITEPYRIPFTANYVYLGEREWKGKMYPAFSVNYRIASRPPSVRGRLYPVRITGDFDQIVYWSRELGQEAAYEETFRMTFEMSNGMVIEYRGTAQAEIIESENMDRERITSEIIEEIDNLNIPDVNVRTVDEGVSISLENIGFYADSAVMLPGETEKLDLIAGILARYPDRDIIVSGHTALAGTSEGRMRLSIERAAAVADYLLSKNVRSADRIVIRGYGAEMPIADNSTEEGMRRNRRVEITILEN
jgi:outer membrane protein OmpA-like peptidoglycan-associated protein